MTLSLFETLEPKNQLFEVAKYPNWLKNNISVLLEPSIIYMEDSMKFCQIDEVENCELNHIINSLNDEATFVDFEKRRHVSAFMSWAAVVVIGELGDVDIEEYIAMEVELQHKWFYVYCLEKNLPVDIADLKKSKIDIVKLRGLSYEVELFEELIKFFDDSSLPERIKLIQEGLVKTSGLYEILEKVGEKFSFGIERGQIEEFLSKYDLTLVDDYDSERLAKKFFSNSKDKVFASTIGIYGIAVAKRN
jgi:hypothetical protein